MAYSYFPTRRSAEKWVLENLDSDVFKVVIRPLDKYAVTDYRKWFVYYPLRAIK